MVFQHLYEPNSINVLLVPVGIIILVFLYAAAPTPPPGPHRSLLLHTKQQQRQARARFEALRLIPATSLANATKHNQASANRSCTLKPLRPTTQRASNETQSGFRMAILHFMATRARLRKIRRRGREAPDSQPKFLKPLRSTTQ